VSSVFLPNERPLRTLAEAQERATEKLQVEVPDLDLAFFRKLVADAAARYAQNPDHLGMERILDDTLFAKSCSGEPYRTAYKKALGMLFGARRHAK